MKIIASAASIAAVGVLLSIPAPASANSNHQKSASVACEWRSDGGPRAQPRWVCQKPAGEQMGMGGPVCRREGSRSTSRYEWRHAANQGPRAPLSPPERIVLDDC